MKWTERKWLKMVSWVSEIIWMSMIFWIALAYFVYYGIAGVMAMLILCVLYGLASLLSLVPFVGVFCQGIVMHFFIWPWVSNFTKLFPTWLTITMFWAYISFGIFFTFLMTLLVLLKYKRKFKN